MYLLDHRQPLPATPERQQVFFTFNFVNNFNKLLQNPTKCKVANSDLLIHNTPAELAFVYVDVVVFRT